MVDRIAREREHDLRLAAQAVYNAEVAEAAKEFRREKDAAYLRRDLGYDALRNRAADLRRMQPRTTRIADELAETEAALLAWRASPPPVDLSQAEEARQRANKAADVRLDRELKAIWARVRSGELDGEE
jgi:hypothetical protein